MNIKHSMNVSINTPHMPSQVALHAGERLVDSLKVTFKVDVGEGSAAKHTFLTSVEELTVLG